MKAFPKLLEVKALPGYRIWVRYDDGREGNVDLSSLRGKGVFKLWEEAGNFEKVYVDAVTGAITWNEQLDICPDSVYLDLVGKTFEEYATH
jgi:hypothetical protein